jgi:tripartite-type tricarboxylate transporter receptor subunit TctC
MVSRVSLAFSLACLLTAVATGANGQGYPNRSVRIIDAFPAGGAGDVLARIMIPRLSAGLGQPVVMDNRPGAGGNIGAEAAAKAPADGYTLFMGVTVVLAPSRSLYAKLGYDALKDFAPVTRVGSGAYVLATHPSLPVKSVKDLVTLAKARPGQVNYASAGGNGSGAHLCAELFRIRAGVNIVHIPYKGGPPAVTAVVAGEAETGFMTVTAGLGQIQAGRMRAIAVTSKARTPLLPEVPTIAESGYPDYEVTPVFGLYVPTGTPREIIARLNAEARKALDTSEVKERFAQQGVIAVASTPDELGAILASEIAQWAKVIKTAGIRLD